MKQIVITNRDEGAVHLSLSREWDQPGLSPWVRGRRVRRAATFPAWLRTVTRSPGLPAWAADEKAFAPRRLLEDQP